MLIACVLESYDGAHFSFFVGQSHVDLWLNLYLNVEVSH
jgi:hypothetical protein